MSNLIVITLDDVSFLNLGFTKCFGDHTPFINQMAESSYVFYNAHCNIPFCQPSRMVLLTGLYPQNNGSTEFNKMKSNTPTLASLLKAKGYKTNIIGKLEHHLPFECFDWDEKDSGMGLGFNPSYETDKNALVNFFERASASSPHFSLVNISVTHRPFEEASTSYNGYVPNFLPKSVVIKQQISDFLSSLRRADAIVGEILKRTTSDDWVVLTSDHGFSFPFVKGNCYGFSTNVPMLIKHKSIKKTIDKNNVVSHVDFLPTIAEAFDLPGRYDGFSYLDCLKTGSVSDQHQLVYSQLNRMQSGPFFRIRAISSKTHTYCLNFDPYYPANFVDGWHFDRALMEVGNISTRPFQEFIRYSGMDYWNASDREIRVKLGKELLRRMKVYKDRMLPISML